MWIIIGLCVGYRLCLYTHSATFAALRADINSGTSQQDAFARYFTAGTRYTIPTPAFAGYITPEARTVTLAAGLNELTQVYTAGATETPGATTPTAPNTGAQPLIHSILPFVVAVLMNKR